MVPAPAAPDDTDNATAPSQDYGELQAAFKQLDSGFGAVRHAAPIESRFLGLVITDDNVQTFVMSTSTNVRRLIIRQILDQFSVSNEPSIMTTDQLSSIEEMWTGHLRLRTPLQLRETKVYTVYAVVYHLSPSWDRIRDLCSISITDGAFEVLVKESELKAKKGKPHAEPIADDSGSNPVVDNSVVDYIARLKRVPFHENLLACITRVCGRRDPKIDGRAENHLKPCNASIWELVSYIYKFHKKGDLEPELPFLRISATSAVQPTGFEFCPEALYLQRGGQLELSERGAVLVHGLRRQGKTSICVYLVREAISPPSKDELARTIKETFEDHDVYHTTLNNGTLNPRARKRYRDIWNIKDSYGVFFSYGGRSFVKWLRALRQPLPTRHGSPRGPGDVGCTNIFGRTYSPWHDPRYVYGGPNGEMRKKFLRRLLTAEVTAWAKMAQQSIREGTKCCLLCACEGEGEGEDEDQYEDDEDMWFGDDDIDTYPDAYVEHDNKAATSSPSIPQERDEGGGSVSILEPESDDDLGRRVKHILKNYGRIRGLCYICNEELSIDGPWKGWVKQVVRTALEKVISANATPDAQLPGSSDDYCIATPPLSPRRGWLRVLEEQDRNASGRDDSALSDSQTDGENDADSNADVASTRVSEENRESEIRESESESEDDEEGASLGSTSLQPGKTKASAPAEQEGPRRKWRRPRSVSTYLPTYLPESVLTRNYQVGNMRGAIDPGYLVELGENEDKRAGCAEGSGFGGELARSFFSFCPGSSITMQSVNFSFHTLPNSHLH